MFHGLANFYRIQQLRLEKSRTKKHNDISNRMFYQAKIINSDIKKPLKDI